MGFPKVFLCSAYLEASSSALLAKPTAPAATCRGRPRALSRHRCRPPPPAAPASTCRGRPRALSHHRCRPPPTQRRPPPAGGAQEPNSRHCCRPPPAGGAQEPSAAIAADHPPAAPASTCRGRPTVLSRHRCRTPPTPPPPPLSVIILGTNPAVLGH